MNHKTDSFRSTLMAELVSALPLPLELITEELIPLLSFSSLLSFLATSKEFYNKVIKSVRWFDWFKDSVLGKSDIDRHTNAQKKFCEWAYRGIALQYLSFHLGLLFLSMNSHTMESIYTTLRLYYDEEDPMIKQLITNITILYYNSLGSGSYAHNHPRYLLRGDNIFLVNTEAFDYVKGLALRLDSLHFDDIVSTKADRQLFGKQISRLIPRYGEYNPAANVLGQYLVEKVDLSDLMEIINALTSKYVRKRFREVVARYLYKKYRYSDTMTLSSLNRVLAVLPIGNWPLFCNSSSIMKEVLTTMDLYCDQRCCAHRPPRRETLIDIYSQSPHQMHVEYDQWLEETIPLLLHDNAL